MPNLSLTVLQARNRFHRQGGWVSTSDRPFVGDECACRGYAPGEGNASHWDCTFDPPRTTPASPSVVACPLSLPTQRVE